VENSEAASNPTTLAELKPSMKLTGTVTKTEIFGAFVDVGVGTDGLIHISRLKQGHVNRVEDVVEAGQEVEVFVHKVDSDTGRLELTMLKPVMLKWNDIKPGMHVKGNVVRLERFGAFVDIGAERPGLVHVSELSSDYVTDPSEIVKVGDDVEVSIIDFDRKKRQIRLTMKDDNIEAMMEDQEDEEPIPTAMEYALRQAMSGSEDVTEKGSPAAKQGAKAAKRRDELENIFSRTLQQKAKSSSGG